MTDENWKSQDLLDNLIQTYQKPKYNPFEIFKPSDSLIKQVIKQLKNQCYELITENRNDVSGFAELCNKERLETLNRTIRNYQYQLRGVHGHNTETITPDLITRAKEHPIENYFTNGKLRRTGKTLVGLCPFHQDKHPSFTIYSEGRKFKCFSCGSNGDTIAFVQRDRNLLFHQAIKWILNLKTTSQN